MLDSISKGVVDWKKVNLQPSNSFKMIENGQYFLDLGREKLRFLIVGISGKDIYDGNRKLILGEKIRGKF